jgi:hypothetical protein
MTGKTVLDLAYGSSDKGWQDYHAAGKEIVPS